MKITSFEWFKLSEKKPEPGKRIIIKSNHYEKDDVNHFRIVHSQYIHMIYDIEYWAYINTPKL